MKIAFSILLIILAVLASGCTSAAPSPAAAPAATPAILGTWTGTMQGYDEGLGYSDYGNTPMSMTVIEQHGRLFSGNLTFTFNSTTYNVPMAGVFGRDGRTFAMVEDGNGYTTGEFISSDEIQLTHLDNSRPISVAIDTLKRG